MGNARKIARDQLVGVQVGWKVQGVLADVVMERRGRQFGKALQVLCYVAAWGLFFEAHGRGPRTDREFAAGVKGVPLNTGNRWKLLFRETFPELDDPGPLWEQVKAGVRSESVEVVAVEVGAADVDLEPPRSSVMVVRAGTAPAGTAGPTARRPDRVKV